MKKLIQRVCVFLGALAISSSAIARAPVPIIDHIDVPVTPSSGTSLTADQVKTAIINAATAKNWSVTAPQNQNRIAASLHVRGKHTVAVSIPYSAEKYSIKYESSINMKYTEGENSDYVQTSTGTTMDAGSGASGALIHPNYNRWVQDLLQTIRLELNKL